MGALKGLFLIVDGMGDLPVPELHGRTPLEAAFTPNLDRMASAGRHGMLDPVAEGVVPHTDSGTGLMMGLSPEQADKLQRGPIEAAGAGRMLARGEVALRANFASAKRENGHLMITDRRAGRVEKDVPELLSALQDLQEQDDCGVELRATDQHRSVMILSGRGLHADITDTDPGDEELPSPILPSRSLHPRADKTAQLLNNFLLRVHRHLDSHPVNQRRRQRGKLPANALITRGAGGAIPFDNSLARAGMRVTLVSGCNTVRGLGELFGFRVIRDAALTAKKDSDIDCKVSLALQALPSSELVFLHYKAPDLFAHDREPLGKKKALEQFDAALAPVIERADLVVACAADHSTDSNSGRHTADPVPALLYRSDQGKPQSVSLKFGEAACRSGNLPRQNGAEFLQSVLQVMRG